MIISESGGMNTSDHNGSIFYELFSIFIRGLSHEIRTPLSVISNQLYLAQQLEEEAGIGLKKVQQIDELLTHFDAFLKQGMPEEVLVGTLVHALCETEGGLSRITVHEHERCVWSVVRKQCEIALQSILEVLIGTPSQQQIELHIEKRGLCIVGSQEFPQELFRNEEEEDKIFLFSKRLVPQIPHHAALLPLIDAAFLSQRIVPSLHANRGLWLHQE